jgi:hypothetical protein
MFVAFVWALIIFGMMYAQLKQISDTQKKQLKMLLLWYKAEGEAWKQTIQEPENEHN